MTVGVEHVPIGRTPVPLDASVDDDVVAPVVALVVVVEVVVLVVVVEVVVPVVVVELVFEDEVEPAPPAPPRPSSTGVAHAEPRRRTEEIRASRRIGAAYQPTAPAGAGMLPPWTSSIG